MTQTVYYVTQKTYFLLKNHYLRDIIAHPTYADSVIISFYCRIFPVNPEPDIFFLPKMGIKLTLGKYIILNYIYIISKKQNIFQAIFCSFI